MYFSQEDYKNIQDWLELHSIKDSEFPITTDVDSIHDFVVITHSGLQYRIYITDLLKEGTGRKEIEDLLAQRALIIELHIDPDNTYIDDDTTLGSVLSTILSDINSLKQLRIEKLQPSASETNIKEKYRLRNSAGQAVGDIIYIYKESAIQEVYLGTTEDTINPTTGQITKHEITEDNVAFCIVYLLSSGLYSLTAMPLGSIVVKVNENKGLQIVDGEIEIKLGTNSDTTSYLKFDTTTGALTLQGIGTALASKQNTLVSGTNIKTINGQSVLGSGNITIEGGAGSYSDLTDKPLINGVTISGNKQSSAFNIPLADLTEDTTHQSVTSSLKTSWDAKISGVRVNNVLLTPDTNKIVSFTVPTKTSDLTNDSNFVAKTVSDLTNYYTKTNTYTKSEVNALISSIEVFDYVIVNDLPTASALTMHKIYLVPSPHSSAEGAKDLYITVLEGSNYAWQFIGSTAIDLSDYVTIEDFEATLGQLEEDIADTYLTKEQFNELFTPHYDSSDNLVSIEANKGLWTEEFLTALGLGSGGGGGGGIDVDRLWEELATQDSTKQIDSSHISGILSGYVTTSSLTTTLAGYTTTSALNTALAAYVTNSSLSTILEDYLALDDFTATNIKNALGSTPVNRATGDKNGNDITTTYLPLAGGTMSGTINSLKIAPVSTAIYSLGDSSHIWSNVYSNTLYSASTTALTLGIGSTILMQFNPSGNIKVGVGSTANYTLDIGGTNGTLGVNGLSSLNGGAVIPTGKSLTIGNARISWDSEHNGLKIENTTANETAGLYTSKGYISAIGVGSGGGGGGGMDIDLLWELLGDDTDEQINASHLEDALDGYVKSSSLAVVATTGSYNSLTNKPTIPSIPSVDSTGLFLLSAGSNTYKWSDWQFAGFLKTAADGTFTVDTNTYITGTKTLSFTGDVTGSGAINDGISLTIGNSKVTTAKIVDGAVTNAKLANSSISIAGTSVSLGGSISASALGQKLSYGDLLNKPTIPATNIIPTANTAGKVLLSTATSGTAAWSSWSSAGFLKTNVSGVVSVDSTSYATSSALGTTNSNVTTLLGYFNSGGIAKKASADANGNTIHSTYVSGLTTSGNYLVVTKNGTNTNLTIPYATQATKDANGNTITSYYATASGLSTANTNISTLLRYFTNGSAKTALLPTTKNTGKALANINATASSSNAWNVTDNSWIFTNNNNSLAITVSGTQNDRLALIQVGHSATSYANNLGTLLINPLGGSISIGSGSSTTTFKDTSTFNKATTHNGGLTSTTGIFTSNVSISGTLSVVGLTTTRNIVPASNTNYSIGNSSYKWAGVYATTFYGALSGNAFTATTLLTTRTLWGQNFNGSANVSGALTNTGSITAASNNSSNLGSTSLRWANIYSVVGNFSGNVSIGGTLGVTGVTTGTTIHATTGIYSDGYMTAKTSSSSSDKRLKNVEENVSLDLDTIAKLSAVKFTWKDTNTPGIGGIALEILKILPELVHTDKNGYFSMEYGNLSYILCIQLARELQQMKKYSILYQLSRFIKFIKKLWNFVVYQTKDL